jgi:hypothetical protein
MASRPRLATAPKALADELQPLIRLELASIAAIDRVAPDEEQPGYVWLLRASKNGKQANVEQMTTLLRMAGQQPAQGGGMLKPLLEAQTLMLHKLSTPAALKAMRTVQEELVARYRAAHAKLTGFAKNGLERPLHRATAQWMLLIAHVAQRQEGDSTLLKALPLPLSSYFASAEDRVCLRCLLDRAGALPALEKRAPFPYTYVCSACHDEVLADFPPDLRAQADDWPTDVRHNRVIERAGGRVSKLRAEREVHTVLSGLPPDVPVPAANRSPKTPSPLAGRRRTTTQPPSELDIARAGAGADEQAYTDLLFDFRSVRLNW